MPFSAGTLCCVSSACVLLDTASGADSESWDLIPHVTQISTTQTANTPKLVTSSTGGQETSACGTVTNTGTLGIACHSGTSPGVLCINTVYRIRWSEDCANIWTGSAAVADNDAGVHFEALIRITTIPIDFNITGNTALVFSYSFDIVEWVTYPDCQAYEATS